MDFFPLIELLADPVILEFCLFLKLQLYGNSSPVHHSQVFFSFSTRFSVWLIPLLRLSSHTNVCYQSLCTHLIFPIGLKVLRGQGLRKLTGTLMLRAQKADTVQACQMKIFLNAELCLL